MPADNRMTCKYGVRCYQKSAQHHAKYKHPQRRKDSDNNESNAKRAKIDTEINQQHEDEKISTFSNNISDSEEETQVTIKPNKTTVLPDNVNESTSNEDISNTTVKNNDIPYPYKNLVPEDFIKEKFLVTMPPDFYQFWNFCKSINQKDPSKAFKDADLLLVGPFDALNGKFANAAKEISDDDFLIHWRYYYDPPEFQTVLKGSDSTGYHIGYFRDEPDANPVFLVNNSANKDGVITPMGDNIFTTVCLYLEDKEKTCNPFNKIKVSQLLKLTRNEMMNLKYSSCRISESMKTRNRNIVAKSFNKIGVVVPYNRKTELGYRSLHFDDKELNNILGKIRLVDNAEDQEKMLAKLQPLFTYTSIALDECDFGTGIELGWNLLFYGIDSLNKTTQRFLRNSYTLLNRDEFAQIINAHMNNRRKGSHLSVLGS